ncbi:MAG: hypothetical protein CYPHOPRED_002500 [Cyphobasidiales sp. Tagirdzhanova-0007]|nr:MAG: hypothetical protein CYPHOPRED_002500 [Cyphobasidiales sp. Tagirdzhanova-0007]
MTSKGHFVQGLDFPVWALAFASEKQLIVAGGGGAGRSGVKNSVSIYSIDAKHQRCERTAELELSKKEDAPMTVATHPGRNEIILGINSEADLVKQGTNSNVRLLTYSNESIKQESSHATIASRDPEEYQKITTFSRTGSMVAVGSSKSQLTLLSVPSMERVFPDLDFSSDTMFDADFNDEGTMLLGASSQRICIYSLPTSDAKPLSSSEPPEPTQVIERPVLKQSLKCTFRASRFGRKGTSNRLYTLVNASPESTSGSSGKRGNRGRGYNVDKKSFVSVWDTQSWSLIKTRTVAKRPVTSFDISPNGKMLAIGGADLSVSIFEAENIRPLLSVLAAHDFPSTCIRFSPSSELLVSGSADNTLRIISADQALHPCAPLLSSLTKESILKLAKIDDTARHRTLQTILLALLALLLSIFVQYYAGRKIVEVARKHLHV